MEWIIDFLSGKSVWVYFFVFFGKLIEVSLQTLRTQLIIKKQRIAGFIVAIFEYTFWLTITASALTGFANDPLKIVLLVFAFALGQLVGSFLESKLALGYCSITAIFSSIECAQKSADALRKTGQALTMFPAEGMEGAKRMALYTTIKRKNVKKVKDIVYDIDKDAVIMVEMLQQVEGATIPNNLCK